MDFSRVTAYPVSNYGLRRSDDECNGDLSPTTEGGAALRCIGRSGSMASRVRVAVYGCTMNSLLLVSVPFAVVTVMNPLVAPSGTVTRI